MAGKREKLEDIVSKLRQVEVHGVQRMKDTAPNRRGENLKRLLKPRHIAFFGGKAVEDYINATRKSDFAGEI